MGPLVKALAAAVGGVVTIVAGSVLSKNDEQRKEWLDEMESHLENGVEKVGNFIGKTIDQVKGALD
jgi:hypothetical protein